MCINTKYSISIINHKLERVFKYEETELSVIKCKDDMWFRGKTIAKILGYSNPLKAIRKHVDSEDKSVISELEPKFNRRLGVPILGTPLKINSEGLPVLTNPVCTASYFVQN